MTLVQYSKKMFDNSVTVKVFKDSQDGHKFLNKGDNDLKWSIKTDNRIPDKAGKYLFAGGRYINKKGLTASEITMLR